MLIFKMLMLIGLGCFSHGAERYQEDERPPETGWRSAIKYFQKGGSNSSRSPQAAGGSDATDDRLLFLDNVVFVNSRLGSSHDSEGLWGLGLGFEWDKSWYGKGVYVQHSQYDLERKFSVLGGLFFPSIQSRFPLYLKANLGLGYFTGDFSEETLTVDYNVYSGVRIYTDGGLLFNLELGSKNYNRLLTRSYVNSLVISSGLAFLF